MDIGLTDHASAHRISAGRSLFREHMRRFTQWSRRHPRLAWVTAAVVVCLVLASIQLLFSGLATLMYVLVAVAQPIMFIAVAISVLVAAALGQLYYYLIMILRQRGVPA